MLLVSGLPGQCLCYEFAADVLPTFIVFCMLLNKVQFVQDSAQLSISTLSVSRATICEILAIRILRERYSAPITRYSPSSFSSLT